MPSSVDWLTVIDRWNRKLHYYVGLYFLFFVWLFALTGLLLNHGRSAVAARANQRTESRFERAISAPRGETPLKQASAVVAQLGLRGEIDLPATQAPGQLTFNLSRPNDASQVRVDLVQNRAAIQHFENTSLATLRIFHTFSGSRFNQPESQRDWVVTTVWVIAMDALAAGLIVMVLGSYVMWYRLKRQHRLGWIALASGFVACAGFLQGLMR
jgi:hypothetical protein